MRNIFSPPVFPSPEQTEQARMLNTIAWATMGVATLFLVIAIVAQPSAAPRAAIAVLVVDLVGLSSIALNRAGRTRLGSWVLVTGPVALIAGLALRAGGIYSPGAGAFLAFVLMAGLLLGERNGIVIGVVCSLIGLGFVLAGATGRLPAQTITYAPLTLWLLYTLYIGVTIALQSLAARAVSRALTRAVAELDERRRAERRLRMALDAGGVGVWDQDLSSDRMTGDARLFALYEIAPTADWSVESRTWRSRVHPDDIDDVRKTLHELASGSREHASANFRLVRSGGEVRYIEAEASAVRDEQARTTRIVGINTDVTERKSAARERERLVHDLGERVKELRLLHAAARLLQTERRVDRSLLLELVVLLPAAWQYPECCEARIAYRDIDVTTAGWRRTDWIQSAAFSTSAGQGVIELAYLEGRPAAIEGPFLAEERALLGSVVELLVAHLERERAQANHRNLEAQLRQSQKMEALGTLAGGIAHDFNNILTAIQGNAELGRGAAKTDDAAHECFQEILHAGARAQDLVRRILLFSRKHEAKREVAALDPIVEEARKLLRSSLPPKIEIRAAYAKNLPDVLVDSTQIHQIIMNLGTNAGHAMSENGGVLSLQVDRVTVGDPLTAPSADLQPGDHVRVTVRDTGIGMSETILARIFDPFFTTKGHGGTGLGLSVVDGIVREHQGAITVESTVGAGTTFRIYLPAATGTASAAQPPAATLERGQGERIMYVDDEEAIVFVMRRLLPRIGYQIEGFSSPHEALQAFRANPRAFDAVVTDMSMPGMSGLELAQALREIRPDVRVAVSSGYREDAEAALGAGITTVIHKPATIEDVGGALHTMLRQAS